jgi:hypothetical protein
VKVPAWVAEKLAEPLECSETAAAWPQLFLTGVTAGERRGRRGVPS